MNNLNFERDTWNERWALFDKRLAYCFSLDVQYQLVVADYTAQRLQLNGISAPEPSTYHVLDDAVIKGADGALHEVPSVRVTRGEDWIEVRESGVGSLSGSLILQDDSLQGELLTIEYRGIVHVPDSYKQALEGRPLSATPGSAFITTRHECSHPKYRWLVQQQLFGFGHLRIESGTGSTSPIQTGLNRRPCVFDFTFDLYAG